MEAKSTVKSVVFKKEGTGKYGPYFIHTITFDNGDSGDYMAKSNPQTAFVLGKETEYVKEVKQNGNYTNTVIKPKQNDNGFKGNATGMNKRCALECAVSLVVAGKVTPDKLLESAEKLNTWLG